MLDLSVQIPWLGSVPMCMRSYEALGIMVRTLPFTHSKIYILLTLLSVPDRLAFGAIGVMPVYFKMEIAVL